MYLSAQVYIIYLLPIKLKFLPTNSKVSLLQLLLILQFTTYIVNCKVFRQFIDFEFGKY